VSRKELRVLAARRPKCVRDHPRHRSLFGVRGIPAVSSLRVALVVGPHDIFTYASPMMSMSICCPNKSLFKNLSWSCRDSLRRQ
jgi:hypothetical protein